jgi:hypothetical protein
MKFHAPPDFGWYDLLRDWGSLIGAGVALVAAWIAYAAVRSQIEESQRENRAQRDLAARAEAEQRLIAATLVHAALETFRYDLDRVRNTFYPGSGDAQFDTAKIEPDRARWLRQRLRPLMFDPVLPYAGRLDHPSVKEYFLLSSISERIRDDEGSVTYGELRRQIVTVRDRVVELQQSVHAQAERARSAMS